MGAPVHKGKWPCWILLLPLAVTLLALTPWLADRMPSCLFYETTGLLCPGCGATRSAQALSAGDWSGALRNNVLFAAGFFFGVVWIALSAAREKFPSLSALRCFRFRLWFLWGLLGALIVFALLRNIPALDFLRPVSC